MSFKSLYSSKGRRARYQTNWGIGGLWIIGILYFILIESLTFSNASGFKYFLEIVGYIYIIFFCYLPILFLDIKRCHDLNHSGWFLLLGFIPFVNFYVWYCLWFVQGTVGKNKYGPRPLKKKSTKKIIPFGLDLHGAKMISDNLEYADLVGANLQRTILKRADLKFADLSSANMAGANLEGANLMYANLSSAYLDEANLDGANLKWAIYNKETVWPEDFDPMENRAVMTIEKGKLSKILERHRQYLENPDEGKNANLSHLNLTNVDLSGVDLRGAQFINSKLTKANFEKSLLQGGNFEGAILEKANFNEANLADAFMERVNLRGASMTNANLANTFLKNARYDNETIWPDNFDPDGVGTIFVDNNKLR